jgi:exopolysaccharide biosynthesis polyprenyl glycosylphosphotransferase
VVERDWAVSPTEKAPSFAAVTRERLAAQTTSTWRDAVLRRFLATADVVTVLLVALSFVVFNHDVATAFWAMVYTPAWILLAKLHGLYDRDQRALRHLTIDELPSLMAWAGSTTVCLTALLMLTPGMTLSVVVAARCWLVALVAAVVLRAIARWVWRKTTPPQRTLVIGTGAFAEAARRKLTLFPDTHVKVVGGLAAESIDHLTEPGRYSGLFDRIILATSEVEEHQIAELVRFCRRERVKLSVVPPVRGMFGTAVQLRHISDLPVIEFNTWDVSRSTLLLKRWLDVLVSAAALVAVTPVLLLVAVAIVVDGRGPIFFIQTRAGLLGQPFRMIKFRTMVPDAEDMLSDLIAFDSLREPMFKFANDPRVTRIGSFLRRTSLDELPQLFNVFMGSMSLVGPRPEQIELVNRYGAEHMFRLSVKPGVTGPMQVYGRGQLTFEERLAVEREYIENLSTGRDLRILAMTFPCVVAGRGAY